MSYAVPNPYVVTTHPYPTRFHGGIWTRPTFGMPYQRSVQSVFKCDDFNDGNPALRGLGADYNVGNGVFGTGRDGGGVFGPSLYGLGDNAEDIDAIAETILSTGTKSTRAFDIQNQFRAWYGGLSWFGKDDDAAAKARSYRDQFNAANVVGGGGASAATPAPSGSAAQPLTEASIKAVQQTLNSALVAAGYQGITADGKIGPGTCGAIAWYQQTVPGAGTQFASACAAKKPWTAPSKRSSGGSYAPPVAPVPIPEPAQASMLGGSTWAMIGGGALAIGLAVIGKKKGWF